MDKRIIIVIISILALALVAGSFWYVKNKEQKIMNNKREIVEVENQEKKVETEIEKEFNSKLGYAQERKLFSISEDAQISSFCIDCKENRIDLIEGQYWEYAISPDYKQYAYILSENDKKYIILNEKKQKVYDNVYLLNFSPDGNFFSYHAYNESDNITYLVVSGKEIPVYSNEGYPHAANGISEAFSADGKHFAYAKVEKSEPNLMHIILDKKEINIVKADGIRFEFTENNDLEYVISVHSEKNIPRHYYDYFYYRDDNLIREITLDEYNSFFRDKEYSTANYIVKVEGKTILINGFKIANYADIIPEVYITDLVQDSLNKNLAYKVQANTRPKNSWVSLNGNDSDNKYNDIKDLHFSNDGSLLVYIGRKGRDIYEVKQEII